MRVIGPAGDSILLPSKKTKAVLAYLCLARGERILRARLAGMIWDRSGEVQALDSLRHALHELNRAGATWKLERERHAVRLDTGACWIDAFEAPERAELLLDSLDGVSTAFDHWLIGERVRFETRWQNTLEREIEELICQNAAPALRIAAARRLLSVIPTHEGAVRCLMAAFTEMDDRAEALREFERFRLLASPDGFPLSQTTTVLYEAIRVGSRPKTAGVSSGAQQTEDAPDPRTNLQTKPTAAAIGVSEPSVAVLPFDDLSGASGREYMAQGITEDLVETLSRVPGLSVVSRLSAAVFKNRDRPLQEIAAALGIRYVISGSIRVIKDRVRLIVELAEADAARALWRSRFDHETSDLLELQNGLAEGVVRAVAPRLRSAELQRVRIKRPEDLTAYDSFLRGQENMHSSARAAFERSKQLFQAAIEREPYYAAAQAWLAYWHVMRVGQGWSTDRDIDAQQAESWAQRAIECDPMEAMAFAVRGHAAAYLHRDFDLAFDCFETALGINPNSARAWLWNASAHGWTGDGRSAVEKINRAMALSPYDPLLYAYSASASLAYLADQQYDRAIDFAVRSIRDNRSYTAAYKLLIPALVLAGRETEARAPAHQLLVLEPGLTVKQFRSRFPGGGRRIGDLCCEALAIAGVPLSD
jgi:TolB-like protein/DNA-binding SARP family transcriptional activator